MYSRPNKPPPLPTHCDAPLTYINVRKALLRPAPHQYISKKNPCRSDWMRLKQAFHLSDPTSWDFSRILPQLINEVDIPINPLCFQELKQQATLATFASTIQWTAICEANPGLGSKYYFYDPSTDLESQRLYLTRTFWEEGILVSGSPTYHPRYWWRQYDRQIAYYRSRYWSFFITPNLFIIVHPSGQVIMASRDHALIVSDLCSQRYLLKNLCMNASLNQISSVPPWDIVQELLSIHDKMLTLRGNIIYDVIYTLEPLCISKVVGKIPCGEDGVSSFEQIIQREIKAKIGADPEILVLHERRDQLLNRVRQNDLSYYFQLYGLYRLWGHPTLEPLKGVIAVKALATCIRIPDFEKVHKIANKFKEEMIIRYIQKNRKWPALDVTRLGPFNAIRQAYENHREYPFVDKYYRRDHLSLVKFRPIFTVDPKFDISELLADKAMSLGLNELISHILTHHNVGSSLDRSVLIKWMQSDLHDPEEFLRRIDLNGFGDDERCNGVREKEREGKLKARLFGLMTLLKRMYIVLTEALLSEHLLAYFPEITMTDDELQLEKKRDTFSKESGSQHCINVSLDFSKWNTNMRDSDTKPFFEILDQMFGFNNLFTRTHEMFENSTMYLLDGSFLPPTDGRELLESIGSWKGHLGGIEGLRQKGWTLWTVVLIMCVAEEYPFKLKIMGQGDNQLLRLIFPPDLDWDQCEKDYLSFIRDLRHMLDHIGPPLKLEETWASSDLYLYGKYPMYRGASYPMSLKKACRAFKNSNEDYPTVESTLSSLAANMFGGLASDITFKHLYTCYLMEVIGTLQRFFSTSYLQSSPPKAHIIELLSTRFHNSKPWGRIIEDIGGQLLLSNSLLLSLILVPRTLGGYPILHLNHCLIKGNPDPLSFDLSTIYSLIPHAPLALRMVLRRSLQPLLSTKPNYLLLFENPTALNLDSAPTPSEARKQKILEYLTHSPRVKNQALLEFLQLASFEERDRLCQYISLCDPMNPRVMALFFGASTTARAIKAINRLNKSPTITTLYRQEGEENLYSLIEKAEFKHCLSVLRQLYQESRDISPLVSPYCSTSQAIRLRSVGWRREIVGVDCAPPQEICVVEEVCAREPCTRYEQWELQAGNITFRVTKAMTSLQIKDITRQGPVAAYRGSITRNKVEALGSSLASKAPPLLQAVCRLVGTRGWTYKKDGNLDKLAQALLESKTDISYAELIPDDTNIAGSYHHRLRDERIDGGGTAPMLPTFGQRISIDTSPLTYLNKGTTNKNVMFQTLMIYNQSLISEQLRASEIPDSRVYHVHLKSLCCIKDIDERPIENSADLPQQLVYCNKESPYLYVPKEKLSILINQSKSHTPFGVLEDTDSAYRERFTNLLAEEITYILDPSHWTHSDRGRHLISPVVISWALPCEIDKVLLHVSLRLIAYLTPHHAIISVRKTLNTIMGKILTSPLDSWIRLSNLAFSPEVHHRLCKPPISIPGQSEGELTDEAFASLLRKAVVRYITCIRDEPEFILGDLVLCSRHLSPATMHSLYLVEITEMLKSPKDLYVLRESLALKNALIELDVDKINSHLKEVKKRWGNNVQVTSESLDYLSKAISSPPFETSTFCYMAPPNVDAADIMMSLSDQKMVIRTMSVVEGPVGSTYKDYSSFVNKPIANPTTASYKLLSILTKVSLPDREISSIACLADGAGGFSLTLSKFFPNTIIFHNTLLLAEKSIPQLPPMPFIPAFSGSPSLERRIIGRDVTNELPSDITYPDFADSVKLWVRENFDLVTGDAESPSIMEPKKIFGIFLGYVRFCESLSAKFGIFKAYAACPSVLCGVLSILMTYFANIQVVRSHFSTLGNSEVYLYCSEPRKCNRVINIAAESISGFLPNIEFENLAHSLRDSLKNYEMVLPDTIVMDYSKWISHPIRLEEFELEIKASFPWLYSSCEVLFPQDFLFWIKSYHLSSSRREVPRFGETTRTVFNTVEIKIIIMSLLIGFFYDKKDRLNQYNCEALTDSGYLIWYRTRNEGWGLTLYVGSPPSENKLPHLWLYPIKNFMTNADWKKFFRLIGLISLLTNSPTLQNSSRTLLNFPCVKWDTIWIPKAWRPKNPWLEKLARSWEKSLVKFELKEKTASGKILTLWDQKKRLHERHQLRRKN